MTKEGIHSLIDRVFKVLKLTQGSRLCEKWFFDNNSKTVEINITDKIIANGDAVL